MNHRWRPSLLFAALLLAATLSHAQTAEQFTEIRYDEAGRVKSIETAVEESAPVLTSISPAIVRRGPPVAVELRGSGLRGASITTSHPGVSVSAVTATATRVTLSLQADETAPLGEHQLRVSTVLGDAEITFTLRPRLPVLQVVPNPLVLAPGQPLSASLWLSNADVIDHVLSVTSGSPALLTAEPAAVSIAAGTTEPGAVLLQATAPGTTRLRLDSDEIRDVVVSVFITPPFVAAPGSTYHSRPLGVVFTPPPGPPSFISRGPLIAKLGVVMADASPPDARRISPLAAPVLGVVMPGEAAAAPRIETLTAPILGVDVAQSSPSALLRSMNTVDRNRAP